MGFFAMKLPYTKAFSAIIHQSAFASRNPRQPWSPTKNPMCSTGANFVGENSWKSIISERWICMKIPEEKANLLQGFLYIHCSKYTYHIS